MEISEEIPDTIELIMALLDFCKGYPARISTFALMEAGAAKIAATGDKRLITAAPLVFQMLINNSVEVLENKKSNN